MVGTAVAWHVVIADIMNTADMTDMERLTVKSENIITLPFGLLGFESVKKYVLLSNPMEEPFMWLQMIDDASQAFLVVPPGAATADYEPDISDEDARFVGLDDPADAIVLNIVTLRSDGRATVNLKGPIVLNRKTLTGKQVIPINAADYSLQHPLPVAQEQ